VSDYIVSKTIVLGQIQSKVIPNREAIAALQVTNQRLEQLLPHHEQVPAFEPDPTTSAFTQARS